MEQECADNNLGERSAACYTLASERIPVMEQACADKVLSEINVEHYSLASENIPRIEVDPREINHDHYRFAYDLVEKVLKIRGELNPDVSHNLPEPSNYLFTKEHEKLVESLLLEDTSFLLLRVQVLSNGVYNSWSYLQSRNSFVQEWESRAYTEKSFISACASIAYVAAYFIQNNYHCGALDDIVVFIARWIGTIDRSTW